MHFHSRKCIWKCCLRNGVHFSRPQCVKVHGLTEGHISGLVQERRNSSALAMELCLSCTKPSISQLGNVRSYIFYVFQVDPVASQYDALHSCPIRAPKWEYTPGCIHVMVHVSFLGDQPIPLLHGSLGRMAHLGLPPTQGSSGGWLGMVVPWNVVFNFPVSGFCSTYIISRGKTGSNFKSMMLKLIMQNISLGTAKLLSGECHRTSPVGS